MKHCCYFHIATSDNKDKVVFQIATEAHHSQMGHSQKDVMGYSSDDEMSMKPMMVERGVKLSPHAGVEGENSDERPINPGIGRFNNVLYQ